MNPTNVDNPFNPKSLFVRKKKNLTSDYSFVSFSNRKKTNLEAATGSNDKNGEATTP